MGVRRIKPWVFAACLIPLGLLVWRGLTVGLTANPIEYITHRTGDWTLRFLLIALAITPLRRVTGWNGLAQLRRMLGLFAFFYVILHVSTYLVLDFFFAWDLIFDDIVERRYITAGFTGFVLLVPLAVTSTKRMIRRAILKGIAIPGYQVPFASREMPMPYGWGTGGVQVTAAIIGPELPVWDIRDKFQDTNMLVTNMDQGRDLAACLGDRRVSLMRGHGCVIAGKTIREVIMASIYLQVNAGLLMESMRLGDVKYLSPGEIKAMTDSQMSLTGQQRAWEYWANRAGRDRGS